MSKEENNNFDELENSEDQTENSSGAESDLDENLSEPGEVSEEDSEGGASKSPEEAEAKQPAPGEENNISELLGELATEDSSYLNQGEVKVKKPIGKAVIIIIAAALVVIGCVVAGLLLWANPPRSGNLGNTPGNLSNYGYSAFDGEWTYYTVVSDEENTASGSDSAASQSSVGINMTNGKETKTLVKEGGVFINVSGNYVYYIGASDGNIYRVKKDGSNRTVISTEQCASLGVRGNYIYYISASDMGVYSMRADGGKAQRISPDGLQVRQLSLSDDGIYYVSGTDWYLYKTDYDFKNTQIVVKEQQGQMFSIVGDELYYTIAKSSPNASSASSNVSSGGTSSSGEAAAVTDYVTYKADKNGKNAVKIADNAFFINAANGYVYYSDENYNMCRVKSDGSGYEKFNVKGAYMSISGDTIYYASLDEKTQGYACRLNLDGTDPRKL